MSSPSSGPRQGLKFPPSALPEKSRLHERHNSYSLSSNSNSAGYGKVAVLQELEHRFETSPDHTIYVGDGSSDLYVMHHVNSRDGLTIAVSESKDIGRIARRTVLSDNATSVLAPLLEDALHWDAHQIRRLYEAHGLSVQGWDKVRTDWLTFHHAATPENALAA